MPRARSLWAPLLAALTLGCGPARPMNVVIIAIDTLRADRLGCYGYSRPTSPRLDAVAREGVVFEQAIAQSPWTLPSFASILTGVLPQRHGAGEGKRCLVARCGALASEQRLLSDLFVAAGYRTGSFVSNGFAGASAGLGRGFEKVYAGPAGLLAVTAAVAWLEKHRDEPVFAFVHIVEPHVPYGPPLPAAPSFVDPAYDGPVGTYLDARVLRAVATDADRRRVRDLYDGDVWLADSLAGRVLDALRKLQIEDRTLVVVVSDHGEELFERGTVGHGHTLYDELLHVPLIVRYPEGSPRGRVAQQVRAMDVFPTVLEAAGLPVPPDLDAVSLDALARGAAPPAATATAIAEFTFSGPERRGLRNGLEKLVVDVDHDRAGLFDLVTDPGEVIDLAGGRPERVSALRQALDATDANAAPGLYLWARGGSRPQRTRLELSFPNGGVAGAVTKGGETGDAVTLSPDWRSLTIDLTLAVGDTDGVRVDITDPGARVSLVSATIDDRPLGGLALRVGPRRQPVPSLPLGSSLAELGVLRTSAPAYPSDEAVIVLEAVLPRARPSLQLDSETRERLRALGYAE